MSRTWRTRVRGSGSVRRSACVLLLHEGRRHGRPAFTRHVSDSRAMNPLASARPSCSDSAPFRLSSDESPCSVPHPYGALHPLDPEFRARVAQALQRASDAAAFAEDTEELAAHNLLTDLQLRGDLLLGASCVEVELDDPALAVGKVRRDQFSEDVEQRSAKGCARFVLRFVRRVVDIPEVEYVRRKGDLAPIPLLGHVRSLHLHRAVHPPNFATVRTWK